MPLIRIPTTLHLTQDEDRRKEILRAAGHTVIAIFRAGLEALEANAGLELQKYKPKNP